MVVKKASLRAELKVALWVELMVDGKAALTVGELAALKDSLKADWKAYN